MTPRPHHEAVRHSVGEYIRGQAHTNGMESFWSMLKRGYIGVYHQMSPEHLPRYVGEFEGRHNHRDRDTIDQMVAMVQGAEGRRLPYDVLTSHASVDGSKPAISGHRKAGHFRRPETGVDLYFMGSCVRKLVWTLVRQLRGPHLRMCP